MKILYIQYTNPAGYPPLNHSSRLLADKGWEVLFLGTQAFGARNLCFESHKNIRVKLLSFCSPGVAQKLHYAYFVLWVFVQSIFWRPEYIYASDFFSCIPALLLNVLSKVAIIYHEHDSPSSKPAGFFIKFCLWARRELSKQAFQCVLPNEKRLQYFLREVGIASERTTCVYNCPLKKEVGSVRPAESDPSGDLWVLYHGSIVASRLPLSVISALALLPKQVRLRVIGYETVGSQGYVKRMQEHAAELHMNGRLDVVAAMPRHALMERASQCDVGLSLMPRKTSDTNMQYMTGASNKPFDYLACGLPLLVSDLPDWIEMYVKLGYGLACDPENPESIAKALAWFVEHPRETREMGEKGRQRILSEWNYENQFAPVLKKMAVFG